MADQLYRLLVSRGDLVDPAAELARDLGLEVQVVQDEDAAAEAQASGEAMKNWSRSPHEPEAHPEAASAHAKNVVRMGGAVLLMSTSNPDALQEFNERYRELLRDAQ